MNRLRQTLLLSFMVLTLFSCQDDEDITFDPPVVSTFEMGEGSTHSTDPVAYRGKDLHMEATILAYANVESITVSIHAHDLEVGEGEVEWDFEEVYTDAKYLVKNPEFHEHIDIPATAPAGEYHVELVITDAAGNITEMEGHLEIRELIHISGFEMDAEVVRGEDFHVEFLLELPMGFIPLLLTFMPMGLLLVQERSSGKWRKFLKKVTTS